MPTELPAQGPTEAQKPKRKSGIPTGNAGEYFVMGELLRRGYDAQLADRNTKGYDLLVGRSGDASMRKVQVKTVRTQPWYVNPSHFVGTLSEQVTVYVLLGAESALKPIRYFIAKNVALTEMVHCPSGWEDRDKAFLNFKAIEPFEVHDNWEAILL